MSKKAKNKKPQYPECEKLAIYQIERMAIIHFLEWLAEEHGAEIAHYLDESDDLFPLGVSKDNLALTYLGIDPKKLEEERRAMLDALDH